MTIRKATAEKLLPTDDAKPVEVPAVYLHPGHAFTTRDGASVMTILGSCVAVCLWDELDSVGGMVHFALPRAPHGKNNQPFRYGNTGIAAMIERLEILGARRENLRAKVFGGAAVLRTSSVPGGHLGIKNVEAALRALLEIGIPIVAIAYGAKTRPTV